MRQPSCDAFTRAQLIRRNALGFMRRDPDAMTRDDTVEYDSPRDLCSFGDCHCRPCASGPYRGRVALLLLGWTATALAIAGVFLPLLPATPFALLAAWAFARSSPRLDAWLRDHPSLGPLIADWRARRAIPRRAKQIAVVSLACSWLMLAMLGAPLLVLAGVAPVMAGIGAWIVTRPQ